MGVHFYFGDKMDDVKKIDYSELSLFEKELKNIKIYGPIYWQSGAISTLFQPYKHYIILGEYLCLSTWLLALFAPLFGKKVYFWTHGWYGKESKIMKLFKKFFFKLGNQIFLYGERAKKLMINEGFDERRLHVIYNSLNYEEQLDTRSKLSPNREFYSKIFENDFSTIIFIGRLTKVKKLSWVIEAMRILNEKGIKVNFCIIGNGVEKSTLIEMVEGYHLKEQVRFLGAIYDEALIAEYICNADVCVSPGNVGLTAMHAMVFGTPVITNDDFNNQMPEYEAVVEGETGGVFINNDIENLASKIEYWIGGHVDREITRKNCFNQIDSYFTPYYHLTVRENVIKTNS
jgi:glycosyltransferase involved in cell wall biosynthesis